METLGTAVVEILGDLSRLVQALRDAERQAKQGMKRAGEMGKRAFTAALRGLRVAVKTIIAGAMAAASTAAAGLGAVMKAAFDYAPVEDMRRAFEGLAVSAGSTGKAILKAMKEATGGTIAARDAMKAFNLAAQLVSTDFAMQLPEAMQYLQKVSAATGESMDFLLESLVRGVGRLSPMILDNLAIQVDLNAAYQEYAAQIGKSVDELTKQEQQTALMNQVLQKLRENTAAMPDATQSAAVMWQRLKAALQDAKDAIGRLALPYLAKALRAVNDRIQHIVSALTNLAAKASEGGLTIADIRAVLTQAFGPEVAGRIFAILGYLQQFVAVGMTAFAQLRASIAQVATVVSQFLTTTVIPFVQQHWRAIVGALTAIGAVLLGAAVLGAIVSVAGAVAALMNPVTAIIALAAVLGAAWAENWGGIREKVGQVWEFIRPIFERLAAWLQTNIPIALQTLAAFWRNTLQPAMAAVWGFVQTELIPTWQTLWQALMDIGQWIADRFVAIWQNVLQPALDAVWGFVSEKLGPVWDFLSDKMKAMSDKIEPFKRLWEGVKETFAEVWKMIKKVVDWIGTLADKLKRIQLPDWLQRHSPAPIELAFAGWQEHLHRVVLELPRLEQRLAALSARETPAPATQPGPSNVNITVNAQQFSTDDLLFALKVAQGMGMVR